MESQSDLVSKELCERTKMKYTWKIWESWDDGTVTEQNYEDFIQDVALFDNWINFWQIWNGIHHSDPIYYFGGSRSQTKIK